MLLNSILVPLPPLTEQRRIVTEVDRRLTLVREWTSRLIPTAIRAGDASGDVERSFQSILNGTPCSTLIRPKRN